MAQFSLRQTLAAIGPGLPPGFEPGKGIRSLFPPGGSFRVTELNGYHFQYSGSLHAVGVTCHYSIDAWGGGHCQFVVQLDNGDIFDAQYGMGFAFRFSPGGGAFGRVVTGAVAKESSYTHTDSGSYDWMRNNWPRAFASGVSTHLEVNENPLPDIVLYATIVGALVGGAAFFSSGDVRCRPDPSEGGWICEKS